MPKRTDLASALGGRRILCLLCFQCLLCFIAFFGPVYSAQAADSAGVLCIVVLPFEINAEAKLNYLRHDLSQLVIDCLRQTGFNTVSIDQADEAIKRRNIKRLNLAAARELAREVKANYAVYGSFSQAGETLSIDARLVEAAGTQMAKAFFVSKHGLTNIAVAVTDLTTQINGELLKRDRIVEIQIKGLETLDKDIILMRLGFQKGDIYDHELVNKELRNIFELGYFEDAKVSEEETHAGKSIIFEVKEKPRVQAISIIGADAIGIDNVLGVMGTKAGSIFNQKILSEDLEKIRELYRKKGYYFTDISYNLETSGQAKARLNVVIKESKKLYIRKVHIDGAKSFSQCELRGLLVTKERGFLSFFTGTGVLKENMLERDTAVIEDFYTSKGFMDVRVSEGKIDYKNDGIHIFFTVEEGPRYWVGQVSFGGDLLFPADKLFDITKLDELRVKKGFFNRHVLHDDISALTTYYNDFGYAYAEVNGKLEKHTDSLTIDVTYNLIKNQKIYIRRVTVDGNERTRDNVIRREVMLAGGDLFHASRLKRSRERLEKLDYFETFDIDQVSTEDSKEMDLKVNVKEKATGLLYGGIGYGSWSGAYFTAKINERNLFGKGYHLGLFAELGDKRTRYQLSFTNPRLYDTQMEIGTDIFYNIQRFPMFDRKAAGVNLRSAYQLGEYTKLMAAYRIEKYHTYSLKNIYNYDFFAHMFNQDFNNTWASVFTLSGTRDSTDRHINPTTGSINTLTIQMGGGLLQGNDRFVKTVYDTSWYFLLPWATENIFHWHAQAGYITNPFSNDNLPLFERFYLGGINSIRGYRGMYISPRANPGMYIVGGEKEFFTNFEYLFPIARDLGLQGVLFFDMGDSWGYNGDTSMWLKKSVGMGIRFNSPFGLIRVEYGYGLDKIFNKSAPGRIECTMGQFF
ncbi:Outer membrane protein assembly factor BamA [Desulfovibrionales bacterium]